ncbi:MAG TPA: electron transfer flavoprotein subunit alpha/FixB family protein [Anaerolineales bacterium]
MDNKIWVYIDHFKGQPVPASWEAVGLARSLADQLGGGVSALLVGSQVGALAQEAIQYGADEVLLADDPALLDYRPEPYTTVLTEAAKKAGPEVLIFPTTTRGRELAAMAGSDLKAGVLVDVTALEVKDGMIHATRPVYAGKLLSKVVSTTRPQIVTLRARAFPRPQADGSRSGSTSPLAVPFEAASIKTRVTGYAQSESGVSLTDANVIVSGGRGVANNPAITPPSGMSEKEVEIWRAQEGFKLVAELAAVLGGAVGASRAAVDAGYVPYAYQVGQTGKVVSPDLYIACGISGAIQHQAGMRTSKVIVAINKDADAPIFKLARYGVVSDLYQILPELSQAFRKKLGKG